LKIISLLKHIDPNTKITYKSCINVISTFYLSFIILYTIS